MEHVLRAIELFVTRYTIDYTASHCQKHFSLRQEFNVVVQNGETGNGTSDRTRFCSLMIALIVGTPFPKDNHVLLSKANC